MVDHDTALEQWLDHIHAVFLADCNYDGKGEEPEMPGSLRHMAETYFKVHSQAFNVYPASRQVATLFYVMHLQHLELFRMVKMQGEGE